MKSRSPLMLIELLIMILVLAVTGALCLRVFSHALSTSRDSELRDLAVIEAQSVAEIIRSSGGDLSQAAVLCGGQLHDGVLTVHYDEGGSDYASLTAVRTDTDGDLCGSALIRITDSDGEEIFALPVAWQTEAE